MKTLLTSFFCFLLAVSSFARPKEIVSPNPYSVVRTQVRSDGNNISTWIWNTGVFNQDMRTTNTPGFEWPKGSGKFAIFTTGLSMGAYVDNSLRLASVSYAGEYVPGYVLNGVFTTNSTFKLYRIVRGDNAANNPDYAAWGLMVPFGAPYYDVNGNGTFEPAIDTPGVRNAAQTIFICLTDADPTGHSSSEGFSGGTSPLNSEMHLTAWSYDIASISDVQFVKMEVVNKNSSAWTKTQFGIVADPDLGDASDDYVGCDVSKNLGYCYNADNTDGTGSGTSYGTNPPAVGIKMLKGGFNRSVIPNADMYMTSFNYYNNGGLITCESDPSGSPLQAYNYLSGYKKDSTKFVNPVNMQTTKYCFTGDPEANTGWTEYLGKVNNCGGDTTGTVVASSPGDRRFIMGSGANNFTIVPGEKQTFLIAQMVARGTSNKNSVTKLKQLSDVVQTYYDNNFRVGINTISTLTPEKFELYQNYPNPFNPSTKIKFDLTNTGFTTLSIFDVTGREITKLVNQNLAAGTYEYDFNAMNLPSGIYFYKLETESFSETKRMSLIK